MRVHPASLQDHLEKGITPFYFLFGPEFLLVEEALDLIRRKAREQGYGDRESHTVERGFNWDLLAGASQTMSLFMEKKILELRMPGGKPGDQGAKALVEFAGIPPSPDTLLVVVSGPVDRRSQGSKWFQAVESVAVLVECPEVSGDRLPEWIAGRIRTLGCTADREAVHRLTHYVEGNLLAAAQQISQLCLLAEDGRITASLVESIIADSARFNNFNFADACLAGSARRAIRILGSLRMEQAEPILILWALTREIRILCQLSMIREHGGNPNTQFRKHGIWRNREPGFRAALNRLSADRCRRILRRLARADLRLKGQAPLERRDIWEEIESIGLDVCGVRIP